MFHRFILIQRRWHCRTRAFGSSSSSISSSRSTLDPAVASFLSAHIEIPKHQPSLSTELEQLLYAKLVQSLEPIYGKNNVQVSHLQSFGTSGLQDLANAILREDEATFNPESESVPQERPFISVRFTIPHHKTEFIMPWYYTQHQFASLLDLAKSPDGGGAEVLSEYLEAACGGNASCSTCHVYINDDASDTSANYQQQGKGHKIKLSTISEAELDMLDYAYQAKDSSRLACQVRVVDVVVDTADDDDPSQESLQNDSTPPPPQLTVTIPSEANNLWK
jgi:ferredoxin